MRPRPQGVARVPSSSRHQSVVSRSRNYERCEAATGWCNKLGRKSGLHRASRSSGCWMPKNPGRSSWVMSHFTGIKVRCGPNLCTLKRSDTSDSKCLQITPPVGTKKRPDAPKKRRMNNRIDAVIAYECRRRRGPDAGRARPFVVPPNHAVGLRVQASIIPA